MLWTHFDDFLDPQIILPTDLFSRGKPLVWSLARHFYSTTYGFQPVFFPFDTLQRTQWFVTDSLLEFEYIELSQNATKMSKERM